ASQGSSQGATPMAPDAKATPGLDMAPGPVTSSPKGNQPSFPGTVAPQSSGSSDPFFSTHAPRKVVTVTPVPNSDATPGRNAAKGGSASAKQGSVAVYDPSTGKTGTVGGNQGTSPSDASKEDPAVLQAKFEKQKALAA